jgi:diaminopimelate decarboxylase
VPTAAEYAESVLPIVRESGLNLILEPGRFLVAQAGMLVTRVVDIKPQAGGKLFVIVDAGMTELMRPMLYGAYHRIEHALAVDGPAAICDIVGPICETTDTLGRDRSLPRPEVGALLVVFDAGAYGAVMASNYNRRPMPAEVLVKDGEATVIRRRQTFDDLIALES